MPVTPILGLLRAIDAGPEDGITSAAPTGTIASVVVSPVPTQPL
jgi:hypothetical protein